MKGVARHIDTFFNSWSPEMAYVLGYFAADGCMYQNKRGSRYISFTSIDRQLIETVRTLLRVDNAIEEYTRHRSNDKKRYVLQVGSYRAYEKLLKLGLTPNKSRQLQAPRMPDWAFGAFLRGYFDGDGNIYFYYSPRGKSRLRLTVRFTCGSRDFLVAIRRLLVRTTVISKGSLYSQGPTVFRLVYGLRDARHLYSLLYPVTAVPCLLRKRLAFEEARKNMGP